MANEFWSGFHRLGETGSVAKEFLSGRETSRRKGSVVNVT